MTKKERYLNVLANKPVDRVPVAFFHHFCEISDLCQGMKSEEAFLSNIEGHKKARDIFDPDIVKIMNDSLMVMPVDASFVKTSEDLRKIKPLALDSEYMKKTIELTKKSREIYADSDAPVLATGFSPSFILRIALVGGWEGFGQPEDKILKFIKEDPESVAAAIKTLGEGVVELNRILIEECGVDGIYFSVNNRGNFFDEDDFVKYILPYEKEVMKKANEISDMNMLHVCGFAGQGNNLDLFKDFETPSVSFAVYAEDVSMSEGKEIFGNRAVCGGFEQRGILYTGTKEEIEKETFRILDESGQIGVILGADCTMPTDIDDNRLEWVRQAAIKYAQANK